MIDAGPERTQKLAYKTEEKNVDVFNYYIINIRDLRGQDNKL